MKDLSQAEIENEQIGMKKNHSEILEIRQLIAEI